MDIMAKIDELVKKIKADDGLAKRFAKEPVKTLEELLGVDLPDEQLKALVSGVKEKINNVDKDEIGDKLGDVAGKVGDVAGKVGDTLGDVAGKVGDKLGGLLGKK
jgi:NTP pyrophosphatase (non-canonical NTP hydrolase)